MKTRNIRKLAEARGILGRVPVDVGWQGQSHPNMIAMKRALELIEDVLDEETEDDDE